MPSYISHAIMGEELYKEVLRVNGLEIPIEVSEVRGYSLGADFAFLSKKLSHDPQNYRTRDFFLGLVKYIKDNKLVNNSRVMAMLYGHIAHYFLDINTHPLIYYTEQGSKSVGLLTSHDLVEGYLSSYLANKILKCDIMKVRADYFSKIDLNDAEVVKALSFIYGDIYGDGKIIRSYKKVEFLFSKLETFIKSGLVSKKCLMNFSRFDEFLFKNNLTREEIVNSSNSIFTNPVTGIGQNNSFIELYYRSIDMALNAIKEVHKYLYHGYSIDCLYGVFRNLSYDTGVDCGLGKEFIYVRSSNRKLARIKQTPNYSKN